MSTLPCLVNDNDEWVKPEDAGLKQQTEDWALFELDGSKPRWRRLENAAEGLNVWMVSVTPRPGQDSWSVTSFPNFDRGLVLHRIKCWWMAPVIVRDPSKMPLETIFLLLDADGVREEYCLYVTLISDFYRFWLYSNEGELRLHMDGNEFEDAGGKELDMAIIVTHSDPFTLIHQTMCVLRRHYAPPELLQPNEVPSEFTTPYFLEYFGWCTWDGFYTFVSQEKVLNGLETLRKAGIRPRLLILDDGWQGSTEVDVPVGEQWNSYLESLFPNEKFSDETGNPTLAPLIRKAKEQYGVKEVLVWHALAGYWRGISPTSPEMQKYNPRIIMPKLPPVLKLIEPTVEELFWNTNGVGVYGVDKVREFFFNYHSLLAGMGVSGVKVDVQANMSLVAEHDGGPRRFTQTVHRALAESVYQNFGEHRASIIHCMCHSLENLAALCGAYDMKRPVIRGSDDFWPTIDSSHGPHLYINAYNALMIGYLGVHDWDMFQTPYGRTSWVHAAARAVSGGPVYVSDGPEEINLEIIRRLSFPDGTISRCAQSALPCRRLLFADPQREVGKPLAIWNINHIPGAGVVALFHVLGAIWDETSVQFRYLQKDELYLTDEQSLNDDLMAVIDSTDICTKCSPEESSGEGDVARTEPICLPIIWNVQPSDVEVIRQQILAKTLSPATQFIAYRESDKQLCLMKSSEATLPICLSCAFQFDIVTFAAIEVLKTLAGAVVGTWAPIGAVDMLNPGGAVMDQIIHVTREAIQIDVRLRGSGRYWFVCSITPSSVRAERSGRRCECTLSCDLKQVQCNETEFEQQVLELQISVADEERCFDAASFEPEETAVHIEFRV